MSLNRRIGGKKAKKQGAGFEEAIELLFRSRGWTIARIPNGCKWVKNRQGKLVTVGEKSPFDYLATKDRECIFFDAKTYDRDRIQYSDIKWHQLNALESLAYAGHIAGYLVCFRKSNLLAFYDTVTLRNLKRGKGLHVSDGIQLGNLHTFNLDNLMRTVEKAASQAKGRL